MSSVTRKPRMVVRPKSLAYGDQKVWPNSQKKFAHEDPPQDDLQKWFLSFTTIGGLNQLNSTNWSMARVAWLLLFFLGLFLTGLNGYYVMNDYFERQTTTRVMLEHLDVVEFPGVTICNANRVHCGHLYEAILDIESDADITKKTLCKIYSLGFCEVSVKYATRIVTGKDHYEPVCRGNLRFGHLQKLDWHKAEMVYVNLVYSLPDEVQFAIAHQPQDLVKECSFRDEPDAACELMRSGANKFIAPSVGVCYSFNVFVNASEEQRREKIKRSSIVGDMYGLSFIIDIEANFNLLRGLTKSDGVKIVIHDPTKPPVVCSQGYAVAPHTSTRIGLKQGYIQRQGPPFSSNCTTVWPKHFGTFVEALPYDNHLCQSFCLDDIIQKGCHCTLPFVLEVDRHLSPMCDLRNETVFACLCEVASQENVEKVMKETCMCPPRCDELEYGVTISNNKWPGEHYWASLAAKFNVTYMGLALDERDFLDNLDGGEVGDEFWDTAMMLKDSIDQNFLEVIIYYESTSVYQTVEEPKYTFMTFMSTVGGTLSLYLGVSFISLFEFVELGVRYAWRTHISGRKQ